MIGHGRLGHFGLPRIGTFVLFLGLLIIGLPALRTSAEGAGYALQFDGTTDLVELPETANVMGGSGWQTSKTVSLWVKPTGACRHVQQRHPSLV